jgi:hypothetical protein
MALRIGQQASLGLVMEHRLANAQQHEWIQH